MRRWSLKAGLLLPVEGMPLSGAVLTIEGDRIMAVAPSGQADIDLGDVVVLPGLVNAHTHLDLSDFERPIEIDGSFANWIESVIRHRNRDDSNPDAAIRTGVEELLATATTLVGDVNAGSDSRKDLEMSQIDAVVFREVIGIDRQRGESSWEAFEKWRDSAKPDSRIISGISPHAPYSTRLDLMERAGRSALPCQIHLAETAEEAEFVYHRSGPLSELLTRLGLNQKTDIADSFKAILDTLPEACLVHANVLPAAEYGKGRSLIHCPATHKHFGRPPVSVNRWLSAGANVGFGTDGRASSPTLNLGAHLLDLLAGSDAMQPMELLRCATWGGAKALGMERSHGSVGVGKLANLVIVPFPRGSDRLEGVIEALAHPTAVLWRGIWRDAPGLSKPA